MEKVVRGMTIRDFPSVCRFVFAKVRAAVTYKAHDPSGLNPNQVSGLVTDTVVEAVNRFDTAHARARKAEDFANRGRIAAAVAEWGKVFRDYFPAYG